MRLLLAGGLALATLFGGVASQAHDFTPHGGAKWNPARAAHMPRDGVYSRGDLPLGLPPLLQFVAVLPNRWVDGQDIHVCFVGGDLKAALSQQLQMTRHALEDLR